MKIHCRTTRASLEVEKGVYCPKVHLLVKLQTCLACPSFNGIYLAESGVSCDEEGSR